MKKAGVLSLAAASIVMGAGYKIPESSVKAVALSSANIANAYGADAAYYNPANMVFNDDRDHFEGTLTYIGLDASEFSGTVATDSSGAKSESESFLVPALFFGSGKLGDARLGVSIVSPAGLTRRWDEQPAKSTAQEFTLQVIELNPTIAVPVGEHGAFAAGVRFVHSAGVVKSNTGSPAEVSRDLTGDSFDVGYNLAMTYRPMPELSLAATYRSRIDLTLEGDAELNYLPAIHPSHASYHGQALVTVPVPATANLAAAYTFGPAVTVEVVYEKVMWSAYKTLDFDYDGTLNAATVAFGSPIDKSWRDTEVYRVGITKAHADFTAMIGGGIDQTPVPDASYSFELPDSDALFFSGGILYRVDNDLSVGLSALVSMKEKRTVANDDLEGSFEGSNVFLLSTGLEYRF